MAEPRKYRTSRTRSERIRTGRSRPGSQRPSVGEIWQDTRNSLRQASPKSLKAALGPLVGLALLAGLGGLVLANPAAPVDPIRPVRSQALAAPRQDSQLICPQAASNGLEVADYDAAKQATLLAAVPGTKATYQGQDLESGRPHERDDAEGGLLTIAQHGTASADGIGHTATLFESGDLRGLVTAPCTAPRTAAWIVAGTSRPGAYSELRLTNPGTTTVSASVTAYGDTGLLDLPGGGQAVIAPGKTESVYLGTSDSAATDGRLAVRVVAEGGALGVNMVEETLDGETPAGVEVITPGADPATEQLVPGVVLVEPDKQGQGTSQAASFDQPVVRLVNPSETAATVRVSLLGPDGEQALPGAEAVTVDPGAVFDVSLAGVTPGSYTLRTTSDQPVGAAVQLVRSAGEFPEHSGALLRDRAWIQATNADLQLGADLTLPRHWGAVPQLVLGNASDTSRTVTLRSIDATWSQDLTLAPGTSTTVDGIPEEVTVLQASADGEGCGAAVVITTEVLGEEAGTLVSALPAVPGAQAQSSRHVLLH
ncbi:DUF5719 family protein [Actinomyces trachealis]|uniref:DUF5719 family protein n=1 Tax=Actinomyces trachealis TaxID=2763540 RepID=UPI001892C2C9|nr:DUF5719 family protein [Actinomyces trachealis]